MKLSQAKLVVVLLTVAGLLFSAAVAFFLFLPTFRELRRLTGEIVRAHSELEAQYLNRRNLLTSGDKVVTARETVTALKPQFLPTGRELDLITAVEAIASRNGVEERLLLSVKDGGKAAEELRVGFDLTLSGPAPSVLQALVEIERMPYMLIFDSAILRPGEGVPGGPAFLSINLHGAAVAPPAGL